MKLVRAAGWMTVGLVMAVGAAHAQESVKTGKTAAKKSGGAVQKVAKPDSAVLQQARREAAARAKAEEDARKLAEEEAREKPLRDADELLKAGKSAECYALLEPLEFERAGEERYDYLLGVSALDSGKPDKATLAFERVLAVNPNFAGARLDMARAYYQLGDLPRAKTEFEEVMKQNPPEAARLTIQKYLDAIQAREDAKQTRLSGYVEGVVGHDSNVNSSTNQSQIAVPALGNLVFNLSQANVKAADSYLGVSGGAEIQHMLGANFGLYAGADVRQRNNLTQIAFDSLSLDGRAGISYASESDFLRVGVTGGQFTLSNDRNRDSLGVNGDWRHVFSPSNQMSVFAQYGQNRFVDPGLQVNDFDQSVVGAGWMHVMNDGKAVAFASYFMGNENDVAPVTVLNPAGGRVDGGKRFDGIRVGGQAMMSEEWDIFASLGMLWGKYDKANAAFLINRDDRQEDMNLGVNWRLDKAWTVRPQISASRNSSNIAIYAYDRTDFSITIRRDFK